MTARYENGGRSTAEREARLGENAAALGLRFVFKPSREEAGVLTEMAWVRDGTEAGNRAANRLKLPWVINGEREGRGVAVFMVKHAVGAVVAARAQGASGPVVRAYNRYGMTTWTMALGLAAYMIAGPAAWWFCMRQGWTLAAEIAIGVSVALGLLGLRHLLALTGVWPLGRGKGAIVVGEGEFAKRYTVLCTDAAHAERVLTPGVQALMLAGAPHGASWWSIGNGWVSCVTRFEQINQTHGKVMTASALGGVIGMVAAVAGEVECVEAGTPT